MLIAVTGVCACLGLQRTASFFGEFPSYLAIAVTLRVVGAAVTFLCFMNMWCEVGRRHVGLTLLACFLLVLLLIWHSAANTFVIELDREN